MGALTAALCVRITDAGLKHLSGLKELQTLHLNGINNITDAGVLSLTGLHELQTLAVDDTAVTKAGEAAFGGWVG